MLKDALIILLRTMLLLLLTALALEAALQIAFVQLPRDIVSRMPQYLERTGFRLNTEHGALENPAWQVVETAITPQFGDMYRISCLSPADAQPMTPYTVSFKRDARGFRNEEPWPDDVDLVVLGDSFTDAELIQAPYWQGISESMLVLAVAGTGTLEQQRYYEAFARPRKPKLVLLAFFAGNDLNNTQRFGDMLRKGQIRRDWAHGGKNPIDYSVIFRLLQYISEATRHVPEESCHYPLIARTDPPTPVAFFRQHLPILSESREALLQSEKFQWTRKSVSEMTEAQRAHDGDLMLMYLPSKPELYWNYLDDASKSSIIASESSGYGLRDLDKIDINISVQRDLMRELAEELEIPFLDLTLALSNAIEAGASPYFFADTHWNQAGHDIVRNALLDFLNRTNLEW